MLRLLINGSKKVDKKIKEGRLFCDNCKSARAEFVLLFWDEFKQKFIYDDLICKKATCQSYNRRFDVVRLFIGDLPAPAYLDYESTRGCSICGFKTKASVLISGNYSWDTRKVSVINFCSEHVKYNAAKSVEGCFLRGFNE